MSQIPIQSIVEMITHKSEVIWRDEGHFANRDYFKTSRYRVDYLMFLKILTCTFAIGVWFSQPSFGQTGNGPARSKGISNRDRNEDKKSRFEATSTDSDQSKTTEHKRASSESDLSTSIGIKLAKIPAGEFVMGSSGKESPGYEAERPQHRVSITRDFYLGRTEVTQEQWHAVMETEPWKDDPMVKAGPDYPATDVSWNDAMEFCQRLTKIEGREFRLPTEAEWEYSCRAGTQTRFSFGDGWKGEFVDFGWSSTRRGRARLESFPHRVALKKPNSFGLYDMHGNMWEWCSDWYGKDYYSQSPIEDPLGPEKGIIRVIRGGGFINHDFDGRSAMRHGFSPEHKLSEIGFRIASSARKD